jgi:hypothetical protein
MRVARAPCLFILTTSVCFCPVLASTREESMSITQRTEQHNGGENNDDVYVDARMRMFVCVY